MQALTIGYDSSFPNTSLEIVKHECKDAVCRTVGFLCKTNSTAPDLVEDKVKSTIRGAQVARKVCASVVPYGKVATGTTCLLSYSKSILALWEIIEQRLLLVYDQDVIDYGMLELSTYLSD